VARDIKAQAGLAKKKGFAVWGTGKYFVALFLPLALLLGGIIAVIYHAEVRTYRARISLQAREDVDANREGIVRELQNVVSDMLFLARQSALQNLLAGGQAAIRGQVERDYSIFCEAKPVYSRVRFVNSDGIEIVRVYHAGEKVVASPWDELDDLTLDDDFQRSLAIGNGRVYVSRLRPRKDDGNVTPVICFATPVFDGKGKKRGVILLDYVANIMLQKIKDQAMLDTSGYWLYGGRPEDRWGFLRENGPRFSGRFPDAWESIDVMDSGQIRTDEGLFTFNTIYPRREVLRAAWRGASEAETEAEQEGRYCWKLVSYVSSEKLGAALGRLRAGLLWFYGVLVTVVGMAALPYAHLMAKRKEMQAKFREYAITDSLTQVYNRGFGLEMLARLIGECKRLSAKLCVVMIDVNNLKKVNDHFGHKAGDALLKVVAGALRDNLREVDVVSRFGGDEFLVVLPFTLMERVEKVFERVRNHIAEMDTSMFDPYVVGFSYGGAEYDPKEDPAIAQLLDIADANMYENKRKAKVGRRD